MFHPSKQQQADKGGDGSSGQTGAKEMMSSEAKTAAANTGQAGTDAKTEVGDPPNETKVIES